MKRFAKVFWSRWLKAHALIMSRDLLLAVCVALLLIVAGVSLGLENNKVVPTNPDQLSHYTAEPHNPLRFMSDWDGPIYLRIAHQGYVDKEDPGFFPLYPVLIHVVNYVISSPLYSALMIAWTSLVGAIYFYLKIIKRLFGVQDNSEALRASLLFILFPTGVFLLATYTESLFAFLALGSLYFALRKQYLPTALFAMFATATHVNGPFVLLLVALVLYEQKARLREVALTLVIGSLGLIAYMGFLTIHYHNPLQFIAAQRTNGWLQKTSYIQHLLANFSVLNLAPLFLIAAAIIYWWNKRRSFSIYAALYLCIPFIGGQFSGFNRYSLMVFPVQFMLYEHFRNSKTFYPIVVAVLAVFWSYFMLQMAGGYVGG